MTRLNFLFFVSGKTEHPSHRINLAASEQHEVLSWEQTCTKASRGAPRLPRHDVRCQLNYIFVSCAETNCTSIHMCDGCTMCAYLQAWMLASTIHTSNKVKYMSTLCTYQALPCIDGPTADGLGHAPCWGRLRHAAQLARMFTLAQCTNLFPA